MPLRFLPSLRCPSIQRRYQSTVRRYGRPCVCDDGAAAAQVDPLGRDLGARDMSNVTDVTAGMTYLLEDADLLKLNVNLDENGNITTTLAPLHTSDGGFAGTQPSPTQIDSVTPNGQFTPSSGVASEAVGRMYQTKSDIVATVNATVRSGSPQWLLTVLDPRTMYTARYQLQYPSPPAGNVATQILLGDFRHDKLREALTYVQLRRPGIRNIDRCRAREPGKTYPGVCTATCKRSSEAWAAPWLMSGFIVSSRVVAAKSSTL